MTLNEAMLARHSVRRYTDRKLSRDVIDRLNKEISDCNRESGLNIQLVTDEPEAFNSTLAHYGQFTGVRNYFALVGAKSDKLDELCGYYGERLVLYAQTLGLNTCWVALTFSKKAAKKNIELGDGEKLAIVIALGYGETQGVMHRSKPASSVTDGMAAAMPDWFSAGVEAALLAPTVVNQQKFKFCLADDKVRAESLGGFYSNIDLGIVKYHFELGSGKGREIWVNSF